jgi:hypothetical protein
MLYHLVQKQEKHSDRVTVLKKVEDKYNWEGVEFHACFDDITTFEENNNRVGICICGLLQEASRYIN